MIGRIGIKKRRQVLLSPSRSDNNQRTSTSISDVIVDARALQDANYRFRGVGQHAVSLLTALRLRRWDGARPRFVALTTAEMPKLFAEHQTLFDEIRTNSYIEPKSGSVLLVLSPMTHDLLWLSRLFDNASVLKTCLFYDLIQLLEPNRYLESLEARADFAIALAFLSRFDRLISISAASGDEAAAKAGVRRNAISVSGVAVRQGLEPIKGEAPVERSHRTYYLVAAGGDPRKNPICAVAAHARLAARGRSKTSIKILGSCPESMRQELRVAYHREGGDATRLIFFDHLSDEELRQEYRHAIAAIVPSHAEGFSVPLIEASAAGTPALASDIAAHRELVDQAEARFASDDPERLSGILARLEAPSDDLWDHLLREQGATWVRFRAEEVGERVAATLLDGVAQRLAAPAVRRGARLAIGILTPLPPAESGVADFSFGMVEALSKLADVRVYTDAQHAKRPAGIAALLPMDDAEADLARLDRVCSVIGNSHYHRREFDFLLRNGGAAIIHDARMINFYVLLLGMDRTVSVARGEYAGEVRPEIVSDWLLHQQRLPILFLSEIVAASNPPFVHSPITAELITAQYGKTPVVLPFAQYNELHPRFSTPESRRAVRAKFDIAEADFLVATFGFVSPDKAPDELVWAVKLLRDWGIPAKAVFCGGFVTAELEARLRWHVAHLDMGDHIRFAAEVVDPATYKALLFAAEAGVQLRTYFMGGLSGALNDCIAAGLPCVANAHLAAAMDAPSYVRRVPDSLSPLLIAEALLDIIATGEDRRKPVEAARSFAFDHSFEAYATKLVAHLDS